MKSAKILIAVFCLMVFAMADMASAGDVKIWDTKVKETKVVTLADSNSWANRANWYQVPYGTTSYTFIGETVIENGNVFLWLKYADAPYLYALYSGGMPTNMVPSGHGVQIRSDIGGNTSWTKGYDVVQKNTADEAIVLEHNKKDTVKIIYTIKGDSNFVKVKGAVPGTYLMQVHAFFKYLLFNGGTDFVVDRVFDAPVPVGTGETNRIDIPVNANDIGIHQVSGNYLVITAVPQPDVSMPVTYLKHETYGKVITRTWYRNINPTLTNDAFYVGVTNYNTGYGYESPNTAISSGGSYTASFKPSIAGKWKVIGRVSGTSYSQIKDAQAGGNLVFTSPVSGTLQALAMILYDRNSATPASVKTPMDIYRSFFGGSIIPPTNPAISDIIKHDTSADNYWVELVVINADSNTKVEFWEGGTLLNTEVDAPFQSPSMSGTHTINLLRNKPISAPKTIVSQGRYYDELREAA